MNPKTYPELDEIRARMLKKKLWVIISKGAKPPEEVDKHFKAHIEHQIRLERNGIIIYGAGPATVPGASLISSVACRI
jgi:hypothetical protein